MQVLSTALKYETERGKPLPSKHHAIVQASIGGLLFSKYPNYWTLPELSISFDGETKVPDLAIYDKQNFEKENEEIRTIQIPLGAIEILSPTQNINELIDKSTIYFENGVKSYWLVVPVLKTIFVFTSLDNYAAYLKEDILIDEVLGIELDLKLIF